MSMIITITITIITTNVAAGMIITITTIATMTAAAADTTMSTAAR